MDEEELKSEFNERYSITARKVLRIISNDSRVKITEIANVLDVSRRTAALKLTSMEKELRLSYTLEFDEERLGLNRPHLIMVKFGSKPDFARIKELLSRSYIPQLAVVVSGTYDMFIYANAMGGTEYVKWDKGMQQLMAAYNGEWHSSEVAHRQLGFFPLRNELIENTKIKEKYKKMLYILNNNSRISFQELAKALGMNVNTAVYNFNKLIKLGYIRSFTATVDAPKEVSLMTFFAKYTPSEGYESASATARGAFTEDDPNPLINRYLLTAPLIGSYDFFTLGAFDSPEVGYKNDVLYHKNLFKKYNIKIFYGSVKDVLMGKLPIRSMDTKKDYKTIVWNAEI